MNASLRTYPGRSSRSSPTGSRTSLRCTEGWRHPAARLARLGVAAVLAAVLVLPACGGRVDPVDAAASYAYPPGLPATCALAAASPETAFESPDHVPVLVRVPTNYRARVAHPLLVVYAAAGMTPRGSERFTHLTAPATSAGFIVAYVQHVRPSLGALRKLGRVPDAVAARWCVDPARIYLTGHSDGGTTAMALALQAPTRDDVAGIAPSAAGFTAADLDGFGCPTPRPVMIWHGTQDHLFPGWGRQTVAWWARCNRCDAPTRAGDGGGCIDYPGCEQPVTYCEGPRRHAQWPAEAPRAIVNFFTRESASTAVPPRIDRK